MQGPRVIAQRHDLVELRIGKLVYPEAIADRPRTRGECADGPRPCPYHGCRYHLGLDVTSTGSLKVTHPKDEPWEIEESCALDVADRGGSTCAEVGRAINVTGQRVDQIVAESTRKLGGRTELLELLRSTTG